jgi:diguanylate cyclase (GGDEF)-like protein
LLAVLYAGDHAVGHPVGLQMMYIFPIWLAAKRGGRIAGFGIVAVTCLITVLVDAKTGHSNPNELILNAFLRLIVLTGIMAFIEHFESNLRRYASMAKRDSLTSALNRLGLDEYMAKAIDRSLGGGTPLTIAMIDCDKFKELNDQFGHEYGDHVLKTLARLLRRYSQGGVVARNGGDEFVLVLPGRSTADARAILNKVYWKFREATIMGDRCASFSYGIARVGVDGTNIRDLMVSADKNMYLQKASRSESAVTVESNIKVIRSA